MRLSNPLLLASFGALVAAASCTLITDVDRSKIPDGQQAGAPSGGGEAPVPVGGEPGMGGMGAMPAGGDGGNASIPPQAGAGGEPTTTGGAGGTPATDGGAGGADAEGGASGSPNAGAGGA